MKISFFSIKTQFENVGDALINREMIRLASRHGEAIVDVSRCPAAFAGLLDPRDPASGRITWLNNTRALFRRMAAERSRGNDCYYFISPGGYVGERKGAQYITGLLNSAALLAMKKIGVRIVHIGVSYERLGTWHAKLLRGRRPLITSHFTRDHDSASYGRSIGLHVDDVMPDLAFGAFGSLPPPPAGIRSEVAFSFRTDQSPETAAKLRQLVIEIDAALPRQLPFRFICQVERDAPFLRALADAITERLCSFHDVSGDIDGCMRQYDSCTHIVSNRLHALLIGFVRGARPVPIVDPAHNQKIIGIFSAFDPSIAPIDQRSTTLAADVLGALRTPTLDLEIVAAQHKQLVEIGRRIYA